MSFAEIAGERGLASATGRLGELTWDCQPRSYQVVDAALLKDASLELLLGILAQASLSPALAGALLEAYPPRPMERALLAYDIATRSLLGGNDHALLARVTAELAPLRQLGPAAPVAVPRERIAALAAALRSNPAERTSLAALAQRSAPLDARLVDDTLEHARTLARAHLPSLALASLQLLWTAGAPRALDAMVEVALDHDMLHALPELPGQELQIYVLARAHLAQFDTVTARQVLDAASDSRDPRLAVVRADLDLLEGKPVRDDLERIVETAGDAAAGWRYACRVHDAMVMRRKPEVVADVIDVFTQLFGNDPYLWAHARSFDGARAQLLQLLSREVRYASHDPHVWRAVAIFVEDGLPIGAELDGRIRVQHEAVFAMPAPSAHLRELERLLGRLRYARAGQAYYDMWEHGGSRSASDEQRAEMERDLAACNTIYAESSSALAALVAKLRAETPHEVHAWADAHDAYLAWVIANDAGANTDTARREREAWAKVRSGAVTFVDEQLYYAPEGRPHYHQLFGFDRTD